jgi:hypothetical protein
MEVGAMVEAIVVKLPAAAVVGWGYVGHCESKSECKARQRRSDDLWADAGCGFKR